MVDELRPRPVGLRVHAAFVEPTAQLVLVARPEPFRLERGDTVLVPNPSYPIHIYGAVIAGAHFVGERAEPLNKINVFPVPDGDTGTNLATTLQKIAAGVARLKERHVRRMSAALADEALGGARGNSGAILAQFFSGFSEGLPDRPRVSTTDFADAVLKAADSAYGAIARPVEGTILTVIRDWARHVANRAKEIRDFAVLLPDSLKVAKRALEDTPKQMAALRKAGVVDAGAQGFVYLLEGIVRYVTDAARRGALPQMPPEEVRAAKFDRTPESILFRYCTEDGRVTKEANPNGSLRNIAGVVNEDGTVLGLMPHPERASEPEVGGTDGLRLFRSLERWLHEQPARAERRL